MPRSDALNLEAIDAALKQHDERCEYPVREIRMCAFEKERLGWDEYRGIPILEDETMGTGRFRLVCDAPLVDPKDIEEPVELVQPRELERQAA